MDKNLPPRASESPARTIDSRNSTVESIETIVDLKNKIHNINKQGILENNTTNNCNINSLTNSRISMLSNDQKDNHIYTSPDLIYSSKMTKSNLPVNLSDKSFNSKTIVTSLMPETEIIKATIINNHNIEQCSVKSLDKKMSSFPIHIITGLIQLILSIVLVTFGSVLIVRGASLASSGSGLWAGGICAIAGTLGVINLKNTQTGFLAVNLICVASCTLAMALTGIGLMRDYHRLEILDYNKNSTKAAISAGYGLIFTLLIHFAVSIFSVYKSSLKLCFRNEEMNIGNDDHATVLSQQKVKEYITSMSSSANTGEKLRPFLQEKRGTKGLSIYPTKCFKEPLHFKSKTSLNSNPIMLIPATPGNRLSSPTSLLTLNYYPPGFQPSCIILPPFVTRPIPHLYNTRSIYTPTEIDKGDFKNQFIRKSDGNKRRRHKSESEIENCTAFIYTGLDRVVADKFLERQESNFEHSLYSAI